MCWSRSSTGVTLTVAPPRSGVLASGRARCQTPGVTSRLMLLDTASMYFRAFYGVPDSLRAPDGTPVNAVRGLLDFIARLVTDYRPTHLACCWDNDWRPQWRVDLIPSYKAHRVEHVVAGAPDVEQVPDPLEQQVPIIREVLGAFGIPVVGADGYEADDVIGTLATDAGMPVDVVTGDRDLFQLVDDDAQVRILYIARGVGRHERVTNQWMRDKYGIHGHQYADFAALRGDPSDGLPGVDGIGEKTAATLLQRFGDIDRLRKAVDDPASDIGPSPRRRIRDAADYLEVAPTVVRVACDLDLGSPDLTLPLTPDHPDLLVPLAERWNLESPTARLVEALTSLR
jgi:5'-3' exonuclease